MNDSLRQYFLQTRQEIDTEKKQRDSLLNFAIAVMGVLGFGLLQNENSTSFVEHQATFWVSVGILVILTSLFWVRRKKLQQIADRWFVLNQLAISNPEDFPNPSLEALVCPKLTKWTYSIKDAVLSVALATPVYALILTSHKGINLCDLIIPVHAILSFASLVRGLRNKTEGHQANQDNSFKAPDRRLNKEETSVTEVMNPNSYEPLKLSDQQKFEALHMRYEDHVELLRKMTDLDLRIFSGLMTLQLVLGGWLASDPITDWLPLIGILILDGALAFFGVVLLRNNTIRRKEAVATLKNVMSVLGFYKEGFYVKGITINAPGRFILWGPWYTCGVIVTYIGLVLVAILVKL